jgi:hypothetical protein
MSQYFDLISWRCEIGEIEYLRLIGLQIQHQRFPILSTLLESAVRS